MKRILTILVAAMLLSCCNNDDDNTPTNPIDQLPPATQIGANTGGALVNGEAFLPNNQSVTPLICNYLDQDDFFLLISKKVEDVYYNLDIYIYNTSFVVGQTYILEQYSDNSKFGEYSINNESYPSTNYYSTNQTVTGELTITHHDYDNAILSGTFWFDAINSDGSIVEIREGRFDMEY
jgi:hypothetical protein